MSKAVKIWFIVAASLVLVGGVIFVGAMSVLNWDFSKLSTSKLETSSYNITEDFGKILVNTKIADIKILPSEDNVCKIVCEEQTNAKHDVKVADGTLAIRLNDQRKWYEHIGFNFKTPMITVYLPQEKYCDVAIRNNTGDVELAKGFTFKSVDIDLSTGDVKILSSVTERIAVVSSTGDVALENISAGSVEAHVTTGDVIAKNVTSKGDFDTSVTTGHVKMAEVTCNNLNSTGGTGYAEFKNVVAGGRFTVKRTTGNVKLEACDAAELLIKVTTGDVKGSLLTEKVFITSTSTGDVDVPKTVTGGRCEIITSTGDIEIDIVG